MSDNPFGDDFMKEFGDNEEDHGPIGNFDVAKWNALLNHIFYLRATTNTHTNLAVLDHALNNGTAAQKKEAKKWLNKMYDETFDYFRCNVCIQVLIDGKFVCNLNVREDDDKERIMTAVQNIPPVRDRIGDQDIKSVTYKKLKSINVVLES